MPKYTLIYRNSRGRAEITRLIFAQAGVSYEDKRITNEEWEKLKPNVPLGTMPVLEVDGKKFSGSRPIERFLAERHGLAGDNDLENLELAGMADAMSDITPSLLAFFVEKDEAHKAKLQKEFYDVFLPRHLGALEKLAAANKSGWLYGSKVTYVDIMLFVLVEHITVPAPNAFDRFPALEKITDAVEKLPNIAKWLKERPNTKS